MEPVEIAAGRLQLLPWSAPDAPAVFEACQDPEIVRWTRVPSPYTLDDAMTFVGPISQNGWASGDAAMFAVKDATTGKLLASVGLHGIDPRDGTAEIGYWCAPWARRQRVTTDAALAVSRWALGSGLVEHLQWHAAVGNDASRRVAESCGFTIEATLRARLRSRDGSRQDAWYGSLLAGELPDGIR